MQTDHQEGFFQKGNYLDSQSHIKRERVCVCWVFSHVNGTEHIFLVMTSDFSLHI